MFTKILITFFISMVPVIELRGALPIGVGMGLEPWVALVVSIIGNMVPVPFIIIFIRRILNWMHRFEKFDRKNFCGVLKKTSAAFIKKSSD